MPMHKLQPIRIAPVDATVRQALLGLGVRPRQRDCVGAIADLLADAASCPGCEPMAILHGDTPVGYYRIDANARSVAGRDFDLPALGLRAFFIDAAWQGRGLGAQALAALIADLAERHRQARLLVLAVASGNRPALRLYGRAGFVDSGALYHGGRSGPQQLLRRDLP
ncbi:MAG: GNAT family N-acetyltransferase [Rhodanobacter sp.]|nr:MAG: GNAT family N-acetyltransferase [Rhodanobacter sp.]